MKRLHTVPAAILGVLLLACLIAVYATRDAGNLAPVPAPAPRGFWDVDLESGSPLAIWSLETGLAEADATVIYSHPSVILVRLFATLGNYALLPAILMLIVGAAFLLVELTAVLSIAQLTRTITRSVHDLYAGTKKVEAGDFSYRIAIRSSEQFSELSESFNSMTKRIEQLIVEVTEKEKLELELELARQVQAQLFPKDVRKLPTLELVGMCNPARVVSGDYYDVVPNRLPQNRSRHWRYLG